ncbi:MAG: hypothetical protein EHM57_02775 [Actinobacteria bacterium]|nr:MAG: hypothetical protein EHM57_02775 [Actinomycetota bacterium]
MSEPRDPFDYENPPGWTDPYADLSDLTGEEPLPQLEPSGTPPAAPPRSPLLTGLIIGLLLVALSVAVFQLLRPDEDSSAATTTTTAAGETTTTAPGETTTTSSSATTTTLPSADEYPAEGDAIAVDVMKLVTTGLRINDNDIPDFEFGDPASEIIGRLRASFGAPDEDTGWQVSTGQWGVCEGELERIIRFGPFAAIVTLVNNEDTFSGYRQYLSLGSFDSPTTELETLSGLRAGDTVATLNELYASQEVTFTTNSLLGDVFELRSAETGELLLWGPVRGTADTDLVIGIYAPDVCGRA